MMWIKKICLAGLCVVLLWGTQSMAKDTPQHRVRLESPDGTLQKTLSVEIAATQDQREKGLMGRTTLAPQTGMLFVWAEPRLVAMWMKDTPLTLDILFISDGEVIKIFHKTTPYSEDILTSGRLVDQVLEIAGGEAVRLGVTKGWRVISE